LNSGCFLKKNTTSLTPDWNIYVYWRKRKKKKFLKSQVFKFKINMNFTKHTLKKLELLFEEIGYVIRYEKGSFNSGYCIVEDKKIAVINKFFEVDGRISTLLDILDNVEMIPEILSEKSAKFYKEVLKYKNTEAESDENKG
jgi:hypothetical protein